jgi:excisionase family DNA binding protein
MDPSFNPIRLLTLAEAATVLQVSTRTLQRMIRNHDLPARKVGGQWRLRETLLMEWIERRGAQAIQVKPSQTE